MTDYLISGADVLGRGIADIAISEGTIVDPELLGDDHEVVDATGLIALPGLVDMHTHLREPGKEDAETVLTGSRSAAAGGFTCVHAMANTA
ncbi:dihydroorotase, partial [Burkholderia multivorans]